MKKARRALGLALGVLLVISCGLLPNPAQTDAVATATVTPAPSETPVPTQPPTSTPAPPSLLAGAAVPCMTGPGEDYEQVSDLQTGEEVELVGKAEGYWVVRTENDSVCWVPDQGVIPSGEIAEIPEVEPPPIPTPAPPMAPTNLEVRIVSCYRDKSVEPSRFLSQFHLYWQDLSNNEAGFHVYRDGNLIAELTADETEVVDSLNTKNPLPHNYYVVAYNDAGEAESEIVTIYCQGGGGGGGGGYP